MTKRLVLRDVERADLEVLFQHQRDPLAAAMAAFRAERPLEALVAKHNVASIRVLEKSGFVRSGESQSRAIVEEFVYSTGQGLSAAFIRAMSSW